MYLSVLAMVIYRLRCIYGDLQAPFGCLEDIKYWKGSSVLKLHENKTELVFGSPTVSVDVSSVLGQLTPYTKRVEHLAF